MDESEMEDILEELPAQLVQGHIDGADGRVVLPILYPDGDAVVVRITRIGADSFVVSDSGEGIATADKARAAAFYEQVAAKVASDHGVQYRNGAMTTLSVSRQWLPNAIIFVAAASHEAARRAMEVAAEATSAG